MNDINQMFEKFHISDSNKEIFERFSNAYGEPIHHNEYEIKTIVVGDTNHSVSSKDEDNA